MFSDPKELQTSMGERGHSSKQKYQLLIHTAPISFLIAGKGVFSTTPNMESWDVACLSLINENKPYTYRSVGVILEVPAQNIIAAHYEDMMSDTNIGKTERIDFAISTTDKNKYDHLSHIEKKGLFAKSMHKHSHHRLSPSQVLKKTYHLRNEILVMTRSGINFHPKHPATKNIKIIGLFLNDCEISDEIKYFGEAMDKHFLNKEEKYNLFKKYATPLAKKLNIPILYLNGNADCGDEYEG